MEFRGVQYLRLEPTQIWDILLDPEYIIKLTPEVSAIREIKPDHYAVSTHIKVGFIRKRFTGHIKVHRIKEYEAFRMDLLQNSTIGNVEGYCTVQMDLKQSKTTLRYDGVLQMDGLVGRVGTPIVRQMINPVIDKFLVKFDQKHYPIWSP